MQKRLFALFLAAVMLLSAGVAAIPAFAAGEPAIKLGSRSAYPGEDVSVTVVIENNPGVWGIDLRISYDKTAMTLVSVENGDFYQNSEWTKGNLNADVYTLSYEAGGFEDITTVSGLLATLNFRVNENAAPGNYEVKATYRSGDIINVSFDEIAFAVTNGSVAVEERPVPVTGISLDKTTARMATGETLALTPVFAPETATNKTVIWSSSDNTVATVDDGVVTAVKKGSATITVKTEDGGFTASCVVTVNCAHTNKTEHPAEASTCTKHGHADYTTCDDCGEVIEGSANELPLVTHTGGTATCKDKAVCEICGEAYGELNPENHTGGTHLEHEKTATCTEKGYTGDTYCSGCGEKIADGSEIPTKPHTPGKDWVEEDGKKVKKCTECGTVVDTLKRLPGDVDGDGEITALDYLYLKRYILGTFSGEIVLENADVDGDGKIDATDYLYLKRGYLGTFDLSQFA